MREFFDGVAAVLMFLFALAEAATGDEFHYDPMPAEYFQALGRWNRIVWGDVRGMKYRRKHGPE
jgi:hypothetical protein